MAEEKEIASFPKIWHLGSPEAENVFKGEVEVTEKIDGSQFSFGRTMAGDFVMRSKGVQIFPGSEPKMFKATVEFALSVAAKIMPGTFIYGESVTAPRHNTLTYGRVPLGSFMIFGVKANDTWESRHLALVALAADLGCEAVPLLHQGTVDSLEKLNELLALDSVLGGEKIEGVVIKNFSQLAASAYSRECFAKLVREGFKERNAVNFPKKKDTMSDFIEQFRSESRWNKVIQHMREDGQLEGSPRDIGKLIVAVQEDLIREEEQFIRKALFDMFRKQIAGTAIKGLPEYYKNKLAESAFKVPA